MDPRLLLLADGRFPSGGHAHSAGAESAIAHGDVVDVATLERFLAGRLATAGIVDATFAAAACAARADSPNDRLDRLDRLDREYDARVLSPGGRAVSRRLGRQLARAAAGVWSVPGLAALAEPPGRHHSVVLGAVVSAAGGSPHDAAIVALHQLTAAITTATVRLLGLDPVAVAAAHARAARAMVELAERALASAFEDLDELPASGSTLAEILAEEHATWSHRLFVA